MLGWLSCSDYYPIVNCFCGRTQYMKGDNRVFNSYCRDNNQQENLMKGKTA